MAYRILCNGEVIGTSRLEHRDEAMGIAFGMFHPLPPYEAVRPVFLLFTGAQSEGGKRPDQEKLSRYYAERDALNLSLETEDGRQVGTGHIHIVDWGPEYDADLEVEAQVKDARFWGKGIG